MTFGKFYPEEFTNQPKKIVGIVDNIEFHERLHFADDIRIISVEEKQAIGSVFTQKKNKLAESTKSNGLFPRRWWYKTQYEIPSVLIIIARFHEKNVNDQWEKKVIQRVEEAKEVVQHRETKLYLVIVNMSNSVELVDDSAMGDSNVPQKKEKVKTPRQSIEKVKNILEDRSSDEEDGEEEEKKNIISQHTQELKNHIKPEMIYTTLQEDFEKMKIMGTVQTKSQHYYTDLVKTTKKKAKASGKSKNPALFLQHAIKLGFYQEILRHRALKDYYDAYEAIPLLLENTQGYQKREIYMCAEYIAYKVISLLIPEKRVTDAIIFFQRHMNYYKRDWADGTPQYVKYAGMCRQYHTMATLLRTYPSGKTDEKMEENPGYYYLCAAECAQQRRNLTERSCGDYVDQVKSIYGNVTDKDATLSYNLVVNDECLVRTGHLGKLVEATTDEEFQQVTSANVMEIRNIAKELHFNASLTLVNWFIEAHKMYSLSNKFRQQSRLMHYLDTCIGNEWFALSNYAEALPHFESVVSLYRQEGWLDIITHVNEKIRICAKALGKPDAYLRTSLELASRRLSLSPEKANTMLDELSSFESSMDTHTLPMKNHVDFIALSLDFKQRCVDHQPTMFLEMTLTSHLPKAITLKGFSIVCNDESFNQKVDDSIEMEAYGTYHREMNMGTIINKLKVTSFTLFHAFANKELHYVWDLDVVHYPERVVSTLNIELDHVPPVIVNEFYALKVHLKTDAPLSGGVMLLSSQDKSDKSVFYNDAKEVCQEHRFGEIAKDSTYTVPVYLQCDVAGKRAITITVRYKKIHGDKSINLAYRQSFDIESIYPLSLDVVFTGTRDIGPHQHHVVAKQYFKYEQNTGNNFIQKTRKKRSPTDSEPQLRYKDGFPCHDPVVMTSKVISQLNFPIRILSIEYLPGDDECTSISPANHTLEEKPEGILDTAVLKHHEAYSVSHILKLPKVSSGLELFNVWPGHLSVTLSRESTKEPTTHEFKLPPIAVYDIPISLSIDFSSEATLHEPFDFKLTLRNRSSSMHKVNVICYDTSVKLKDRTFKQLFFSGSTFTTLDIAPFSSQVLPYRLFPALMGFMSLPKFYIHGARTNTSLLFHDESWKVYVK